MSLAPLVVAAVLIVHGAFVSQVLAHPRAATLFHVSGVAVIVLRVLMNVPKSRGLLILRVGLYAICLLAAVSMLVVAVMNLSAIELPFGIALAGSATACVVTRRPARLAFLIVSLVAVIPAGVVVAFEWFMKP